MKVLIVDDEILVRKGIAMGIDWHTLGFEVVLEASHGIEAFELVKREQPELVFTDICMPKMGGIELIDQIKMAYPDTVIIVLSCLNEAETIREALRFNRAIDFIPKLSLSTEELKDIVVRAKSYIVEGHREEKKYPSIFTLEKMHELQMAIEAFDEIAAIELVKNMLYEAIEIGHTLETFYEWQDIIGVFSNHTRMLGGELSQVMVSNQSYQLYLNQTKNLDTLAAMIPPLVRAFFLMFESLTSHYIGKDIKLVIKYIHEHYQEAIMLSDVADQIGLNHFYISRLFKKQMGINFSDYLNKFRIQVAKRLLDTTECSISEIGELVGYNSESYFSRIFKSYEGCSPRAYQKHKRNN